MDATSITALFVFLGVCVTAVAGYFKARDARLMAELRRRVAELDEREAECRKLNEQHAADIRMHEGTISRLERQSRDDDHRIRELQQTVINLNATNERLASEHQQHRRGGNR